MQLNLLWRYALLAISAPLALATPVPVQVMGHHITTYPRSTIPSFKLVAKVTDQARDLSPSVHGLALRGASINSSLSVAVLDDPASGLSFGQSGWDWGSGLVDWKSVIRTSARSPPTPHVLVVGGSDDKYALGMNERRDGAGSAEVAGLFLACREDWQGGGITMKRLSGGLIDRGYVLIKALQDVSRARRDLAGRAPTSTEQGLVVAVKAFRDDDVIPDNCAVIRLLGQ
ncbi:hypothetical protein GGR54DRAFT_223297 [Hypoxylon sp. NC1633]|nr:hypothetical protein GGR54DRAFT_223297 [Hypoxylon sp. NC1633]